MSKEQLQELITQKEGLIFSEGTHNLTHLLPSAYDLIKQYGLDKEDNKAAEICKDIEKIFVNTDPEETEKLLPTFRNQYYNKIYIPEEKQEEAGYIFNEAIFNYFNDIVPEGFYFSSHPGNGSCFGFWKIEEEF